MRGQTKHPNEYFTKSVLKVEDWDSLDESLIALAQTTFHRVNSRVFVGCIIKMKMVNM